MAHVRFGLTPEALGTGKLFKTAVVFVHGFVGWGYCGALIAFGREFLPLRTTLVIHAVATPIGFALISLFYFRKFQYTTPFQTALIYLAIVIGLDFFVVAPIFERSYVMFSSLLGTWLPIVLIFLAVYVSGRYVTLSRLPLSPRRG
jgi:hypothetical protein